MLSQRRFSQKGSLSHSLNMYSNENFHLIVPNQEQPLKNSFAMLQPKIHKKTYRKGLGEIQKNNNNRKDIVEEGWSKVGVYQAKQHHEPIHTFRNQDQLFSKISQLIKYQENGVPSQQNKIRSHSLKKQRPYTSLSIRNRISQDMTALGKYHVVLDLTPKQEPQQMQDPSKISTSRALMNFSKVYRNNSGDRFKVRRDKHANQLSLISAQRVVLLEKEKVLRKQPEKLPEQLPSSLKKRRQSRLFLQKKQAVKNRYFEEQQFQIDGWQYFE